MKTLDKLKNDPRYLLLGRNMTDRLSDGVFHLADEFCKNAFPLQDIANHAKDLASRGFTQNEIDAISGHFEALLDHMDAQELETDLRGFVAEEKLCIHPKAP